LCQKVRGFEQYNEAARMAMVLANRRARSLRHSHVGTEHFLLAVFDLPDSLVPDRTAADALRSLGVSPERVMGAVQSEGDAVGDELPTGGALPISDELKHALGATVQQWPRSYVGAEHVLLAIFEQPRTPVGELAADRQAAATELIDALGVSRERAVEKLRSIVDCSPMAP
jgi:ATP-dependent Clp protease ATP-binding subunit ClpA